MTKEIEIEIDEDLLQQQLDQQFSQEIDEFVATLPEPDAAQKVAYQSKLDFMNSIHAEIKAKNPNFMPDYVPEESEPIFDKAKYCENVYRVADFSKSED